MIRLRLPALRERQDDIPMLTRHFLQQSAQQLGIEPKRISDAALASLSLFPFPGNVRQLENICHWLTVMAPTQLIEAKDLPPEVTQLTPVLGTATAVHISLVPVIPIPDSVESNQHPAISARPLLADTAGLPEPSSQAVDVPETHDENRAASSITGVQTGLGHGAPWEIGLEAEAMTLLANGRHDVWDALTRRFESRLILTALANTRGRRIEAASKLGIGRNTITRKIQELGLED